MIWSNLGEITGSSENKETGMNVSITIASSNAVSALTGIFFVTILNLKTLFR